MRIDRNAMLALILLMSAGSVIAAPLQSVPASTLQQPAADEPGKGAQDLPEDVRGYILKHRMCMHFRKDAESGDADVRANATQLAKSVCPAADAATWKKLVRKYQGQDTIGGILLAERPPEIRTK
ncbi:hypothetical protein [Solilutibacter silvestris]|uniref:Secreted protein n=1 Tax=Solilutibacter silvestris TaxID=1645665 RepID=A0A2K1PZX1_9GAMM|nr:hypothetical protein [Lysobacter silvestris]PNS08341.1 hypothetical protein Lysil_2517 [Lysobacter silvestris]